MIVGEASATVQASPQKVIDFVLDCEETPDGTVVRHREVFMFKKPWCA